MRIRTLPIHVANQIAAGEVIERPASVVKELLENALDAGAENIHVDVGFGGLNQIKVSDDGRGILAEDLPLAIAPHATSKLHELDDLYAISSMGFRGEALASVVSVARVLIQSRAKDSTDAMALEHDEAGTRLIPCARNQGTTVDVRDLFFNAPVRKKFLKPERQEYQAIEAVVKRLAFCEADVAFTLSHNGEVRLTLPKATSEEKKRARLSKLLGKNFVEEAQSLDVMRGQMRLHGWVSGPQYARSQQDKLWFYINQRMVRDKLVLHAIKEAYASILPTGRHPACVLFLNIPADEVDVNVHPTKHEVRFCDARSVHDFIRSSITKSLNTEDVHHAAPLFASEPLEQGARHEPASYAPSYRASSHHGSAPMMVPETTTRLPWFVLHATCAVLMHAREAYLIDVARLNQAMQAALFAEEASPKARRPLLVPVKIHTSDNARKVLEDCRFKLEDLGLVYTCEASGVVCVRMIPSVLPHLNLHDFFEALTDTEVHDEAALINLLLLASPVNLLGMDTDEQAALVAHWEVMFAKGTHKEVSVCMNAQTCQKVFETCAM